MNTEAFLKFHTIIEKLKHLKRTGWVLRGVPDPETVASHSFRMALMILTLQTELLTLGINFEKLLKMVLYHDIGESIIGDIVPEHVDQPVKDVKSFSEKLRMERMAIYELASIINIPEIASLWEEMQEGKTLEAQIAKDIDVLDMALQAKQYYERYPEINRLDEFTPYCIKVIQTELGKSILDSILMKK